MSVLSQASLRCRGGYLLSSAMDEWSDVCCEVDQNASSRTVDLYASFAAWLSKRHEGATPPSLRAFALALGRAGVHQGNVGGQRVWLGLKLRAGAEKSASVLEAVSRMPGRDLSAINEKVAQWAAERCVEDIGAVELAADLYADYTAWAGGAPGRSQFGLALRSLPLGMTTTTAPVRVGSAIKQLTRWHGLELKNRPGRPALPEKKLPEVAPVQRAAVAAPMPGLAVMPERAPVVAPPAAFIPEHLIPATDPSEFEAAVQREIAAMERERQQLYAEARARPPIWHDEGDI